MWLNCKAIKKRQPLISTSTPPFQVYPSFLSKNFKPPNDSIFGRSYPLPPLIRGGGVPTMLPPRQLSPRIIAPEKNWGLENCPLDDCPRIIAPGQLPKDNCILTISPWKLPPRIAFRMICRLCNYPSDNGPDENCPPGKLPQG